MSPLPGRGTVTTVDGDAVHAAMVEELGDPPPEVQEALDAAAEAQESAELDDDVSAVVGHLDAAIAAAHEEGMSAAELMGMLFYYAHNVAQGAREGVLVESAEA